MNIKELNIRKENEKGKIYDADKFMIIFRNKQSVSADHVHEKPETLFLIQGEIEVTVGDETKVFNKPAKIDINPNTYHKIIALTDAIFLEEKKE
ncbi:MAG: hypothetical protein KKF89_03465 [Nanoarchaeota archaeon]|nr:hypothetical protein [Nanoarchaeota archaeon]MBU1854754.1 hypothetical protein [Nanoarchaeota archaeon]